MQPNGCMDIEPEPFRRVPCQGLFRTPTNPARPYSELRTWKAEVFSVTGFIDHALHLRLLLLWTGDIELSPGPTCSGCSKSMRSDITPIICLTCQRHFHRTCSRLTRSQKDIQGFVCFFCSGCAAVLPSTATVTSNSVLLRRCPLCHIKIRHGIRPNMCQQCSHLAHRKCSDIFRCVANTSWLHPACSLPTTSISTQPTMAMTNNTHAPSVLPHTSNMNYLFPPIILSSTPHRTIAHAPAAYANPNPYV